MVVGALHGLLVAVSFVVGRSLHRGVLRIATHRWALGMTVETLGWASMTLRPLLPELVAVVLSNGLTALGVALLADAVRMVLGCRRPPHLRFVVPIAIVTCLAPLTWPTSYFHARVSVMSIASALQLADMAWPLLRQRGATPRLASDTLVGVVVAGAALLFLLRFCAETLNFEVVDSLFSATPLERVLMTYLALSFGVVSVGFLTMCNVRREQELALLATNDPLTLVANRRGLEDHATRVLDLAKRTGSTTAVVMFDVDHFKAINDTHGHDVGDRVLVQVATTLRDAMRVHDGLARVGGEEFVVVLARAGLHEARIAAERMRRAVERAGSTVQDGLCVTVSAGVASCAAGELDLTTLLRNADDALYAAKRRGRNRVEVFEPSALQSRMDF